MKVTKFKVESKDLSILRNLREYQRWILVKRKDTNLRVYDISERFKKAKRI